MDKNYSKKPKEKLKKDTNGRGVLCYSRKWNGSTI